MTPERRFRIAAAVAGVAGIAAALEIALLLARSGAAPSLIGVFALAALGSLVGAVLTFAPGVWVTGLLARATQLVEAVRRANPPDDALTGRLLAILAFAAALTILTLVLSRPQDPWDDDQGAYLMGAQQVQARGGIPQLVRDLYSGRYAEANRHPLFIGLLSLFPELESGQRLAAVAGIVGLGGLMWLACRRFGWMTAGLFGVLLATNASWVLSSTRVVCEGFVILWSGLAWLVILPPREEDGRATPVAAPRLRLWQVATAGGLLGLAWLTKGTGLLLFVGFLAWLTVRGVWRQPRRIAGTVAALATAVACFAVVSSPLLTRNVRRFGDPFYNVNSQLLFVDAYEDPEQLAGQRSTAAAAQEYVATHSVGDVIRREARGLVWEAFIILRSLGPAPLEDARVLPGLMLALLALLSAGAAPRPGIGLLALWGGLLWGMFAWYVPIAAGDRFVLPLLAPTLGLAADAISRLAAQGTDPQRARRRVMLFAAAWAAVWTVATARFSGEFAAL